MLFDSNPQHADRYNVVSIILNNQFWSFAEVPGVKIMSPTFPIKHFGTATNKSCPSPVIRYAVDSDLNIWIGNDENGIMFCDDQHHVLSILFLYNPLAWASVCEQIGNNAVQEIINSCDWSMTDGIE